ncbi:hypothetical protein HYX05_02925 [Candidatus Woesearchaeota archaeon]|nr:hypothetical protein [Candidatus Woesearchaeota archaeon]
MGTLDKLTRRGFLAGSAIYLTYEALKPLAAEASHLWYCPSHECQYIVQHKQPDFEPEISELERKLQGTFVKTFIGELNTIYGKSDMLVEAMVTKEGYAAAYFVYSIASNEKTRLRMAVVPREGELPVVYDYRHNSSKNAGDLNSFWKNPKNIKSKQMDDGYVYLDQIEGLFKKRYPEYNKEPPKRKPMPIIRGELLVKK